MKLTNKQINEIIKSSKKGEKPKDLAIKYNVNISTISYWINNNRKEKSQKCVDRFRSKSLEERQKIYKERLPYLRKYQKKRYNEDKEFRENKKRMNKKTYENKKVKNER